MFPIVVFLILDYYSYLWIAISLGEGRSSKELKFEVF